MRRIRSSLLFLALLCLPAPFIFAEDPTKDPSRYYPLKIGTQWQYQIGTKQISMRVARQEKLGDVMCGVVETSVDGKVVGTEHISAGPEGVFRHSFNDKKASEPLCILKLPATKGQTWKFDVKIATETVKGAFVSGEESVTVPAGTYTATTAFTTECDLNGQKAEFKYWFATGVGIVRQTISLNGQEFASELKKYEPAK
jgi:hypothetical protein